MSEQQELSAAAAAEEQSADGQSADGQQVGAPDEQQEANEREAGAAACAVTHTHIGGQAVLEGVMMRGKLNWAVAVRLFDGSIHVEEHDLASGTKKHAWMRWPVVRGVVGLVESLSLAMKALSVSASVPMAGEDEVAGIEGKSAEVAREGAESAESASAGEEPAGASQAASAEVAREQGAAGEQGVAGEQRAADKQGVAGEQLSAAEVTISAIMGIGLAVLLFIVLPAVLTNFIVGSAAERPLLWNLVDGLLRVVAFFIYIWAVSRMRDIQRVFSYHGAEHKVIHAYEQGLPLEPSAIQRHSTQHVRCGTSFLLMVMIIAILVFSLVPVRPLAAWIGLSGRLGVLVVAILSRLVLIPVVAGLAYEVTVKWAGKHAENPVVKVLLWPGLQLQRMTTREPDDEMIEVAVAAIMPVIDREAREGSCGLTQ
ncbi:MAG: DUF1385 domain-containing protein [Coriobacteriia bacterium]|nr:DUF1385 domain-containing protein [Coriobacteriia bacterium]